MLFGDYGYHKEINRFLNVYLSLNGDFESVMSLFKAPSGLKSMNTPST